MDARMRRYGLQTSPERTKVWTEPPPKHQPQHHHSLQQQQQQQQEQGKRVPVVYYLSKNRHLEHPHFIEVPLSSPEGLYLKDVVNRLNVLRGRKMAAMYSWSCKRSYKSGFVWHDLSEDDLIIPAQGNEYVLKGSELLDKSPAERSHRGSSSAKVPNATPPFQGSPVSHRVEEDSSRSSAAVAIREAKPSSPPLAAAAAAATTEDELSPTTRPSISSGDSFPSSTGAAPSSGKGSRSPIGARACKPSAAQDASIQTDSRGMRRARAPDTRVVGVSTDDQDAKHTPEVAVKEKRSPPPTASTSASPSCGKTTTLESLIRDEINSRNSFRISEEEQLVFPTRTKLKASNTLMQLLTCGSISVKDHYGFALPPSYKSMFASANLSSPATFSSSVTSVDTGGFSESQRSMGARLPKKEHCSRNTAEAKSHKERAGEPAVDALKRSSAFDDDRSCKMVDSKRDSGKEMETSRSNCLPRTIKIAACRHSGSFGNDTMLMSPMSDMMSYISGSISCMSSPLNSSKVGSRRIVDSSSEKGSSMRFGSFREEKEKAFKIEESLLLELGL